MATVTEVDVTVIHNPATGEEVGRVPRRGADDASAAVARAADAFPAWWETPAARRGELLHEAASAVLAARDELSSQLTLEQGKPLREARLEITRFVHTLEHYAGLAKNLRGAYVPSLDVRTHGLVVKRPLGVVVAIVPWNFPTTLLGNKLGPALVCGNVVVAKPAETTPLTTLRIAGIMREHGLPEGVFQVVTGKGSVLGEALVTDARVAKVAFTGSTPVGKHVAELAARGVKRVTLELGGSDPMIVLDDADVDAAVERRERRPVLQLRAGLSGDQAPLPARGDRRRVRGEARLEGRSAHGRRRDCGRDDDRPAAQRGAARDPGRPDRLDTGARRRAARRRRPARRRRVRERLVLRADADPGAPARLEARNRGGLRAGASRSGASAVSTKGSHGRMRASSDSGRRSGHAT